MLYVESTVTGRAAVVTLHHRRGVPCYVYRVLEDGDARPRRSQTRDVPEFTALPEWGRVLSQPAEIHARWSTPAGLAAAESQYALADHLRLALGRGPYRTCVAAAAAPERRGESWVFAYGPLPSPAKADAVIAEVA